ncbi:hypothetical protein CR956_00825 [Candidatus Saccharibacteria bacterium]|nr:MAG: hypothetical protein CR956_00825 [Candidatus Saccharibacteria bacterium]
MKILIVGVQHGNEVFGADVIEYCKDKYSTVDGVLANPRAYKKGIRFCETDMNRSYNLDKASSYEEKRAIEILKMSADYDLVIDIHTTTADMEFVSIIADYNYMVARALSFVSTEPVVKMEFPTVKHSLIGSVQNSLSLEFNEDFAKTKPAMKIIDDIIEGLQTDKLGDFTNKIIYHTLDTIPEDADIEGEINLVYSQKLKCFPVLIGEKNYVGYSGFGAKTVTKVSSKF